MSDLKQRFRNVLLCEDIRDEVGRKHSLMGVYSGDIVLPEMPALLQLAGYVQYELAEGFTGEIHFKFQMFLDDTKIGEGAATSAVTSDTDSHAVIVLPKGLLQISKPCTYRVVAWVDDQQIELISKKIFLGEISRSTGT